MAQPAQACLVTGATGFIGEHLARRLVRTGWQVSLLVRDRARLAPDLDEAATIITGSLADQAALAEAVHGREVVLHCAANVKTWDSREAYRETNVEGVRRLLEAVATTAPGLRRFVHLSTVDVYGYPDHARDETDVPSSAGFGYGDSKAEGEALVCREGARLGIPYAIIRPCNVIGPGSQFVARIGKELQSGLMLTIDRGRAHAGLTDVENLVDTMVWAATAEAARDQVFNARDGHDATWADFVTVLKAGIDGRGLVIDLPFGLADLAARLAETVWRVAPGREPILHRMLVRMFGRTCGHGIAKLRAAGAPEAAIGYEEAMARSIAWYLDSRR